MDTADQDRIDGRKWADEVLTDLAAKSGDYQMGFWREIRRRQPTPDPLKAGLMTDDQSREFGRRTMYFGMHLGKRYDEAPLDYLEWLADQNVELARYVGSRRVQAEHTEN